MTWFLENEKVAEIQLAEIAPRQRKKDYGKRLLNAILEKLTLSGIRVAKLHCRPAASENVWKKLGFNKFPNFKAFVGANSPKGKHLFKILNNVHVTTEKLSDKDKEYIFVTLDALITDFKNKQAYAKEAVSLKK